MPVFKQQQISPYSVEQLFQLVADVERYPEFLPWCRAARIVSRQESEFLGELIICFKHICENYTSRVQLFPAPAPEASRIEVAMTKGPFSHLVNRWQFTPLEQGGTQIDFFIDFGFRSRLLEKLIGPLFGSAAEKMADAFKTRANSLYGTLYGPVGAIS